MEGDTRDGETIRRSVSIEIPDKEKNEAPATQKQIDYIHHLTPEIEKSGIDLSGLGKWQASTLIDQILGSQNQLNEDIVTGNVPQTDDDQKSGSKGFKLALVLIIGIVVVIWAML